MRDKAVCILGYQPISKPSKPFYARTAVPPWRESTGQSPPIKRVHFMNADPRHYVRLWGNPTGH